MAIKVAGQRKLYHPKDSDEVMCEDHGVVTTWGALNPIQKLAVESGLDTIMELECILAQSEDARRKRGE